MKNPCVCTSRRHGSLCVCDNAGGTQCWNLNLILIFFCNAAEVLSYHHGHYNIFSRKEHIEGKNLQAKRNTLCVPSWQTKTNLFVVPYLLSLVVVAVVEMSARLMREWKEGDFHRDWKMRDEPYFTHFSSIATPPSHNKNLKRNETLDLICMHAKNIFLYAKVCIHRLCDKNIGRTAEKKHSNENKEDNRYKNGNQLPSDSFLFSGGLLFWMSVQIEIKIVDMLIFPFLLSCRNESNFWCRINNAFFLLLLHACQMSLSQ